MGNQNFLELWLEAIEKEEACVYVKTLGSETINNRAMFIKEDGSYIGSLSNREIDEKVIALSIDKLNEKNPSSKSKVFPMPDGKEIHVFIDVYKPQPKVVIFGAGHDAIPLVSFISKAGFNVTVVDQRPLYNSEDRFPEAEQRIISRSDAFSENVFLDKNTFVIIMNHHMERDQEALLYALDSPAPYIGLLGPRSRRERITNALEANGKVLSGKDMKRLYNPIGLDIGARTSEEIAISIVAEIIALKNGYPGGFLRGTRYIHRETALRGDG